MAARAYAPYILYKGVAEGCKYIPMGIYPLLCSLTTIKSFLRFRRVKNKARDKRLFHIWIPTSAVLV